MVKPCPTLSVTPKSQTLKAESYLYHTYLIGFFDAKLLEILAGLGLLDTIGLQLEMTSLGNGLVTW